MPVQKDAGTILRAARQAADVTLEELAREVDVSIVFLSDVERGRRTLPFEHWGTVFRALPNLAQIPFAIASLRQGRVRIDGSTMSNDERLTIATTLVSHALKE